MAVDTALKRRSIVNPGSPWRGVIPRPDGTFSAGDRYALLNLYGGLVATVPVQTGSLPNASAEYNTGTYEFDYSTYFEGQTSYSIAPAVEIGWTFNTSTGVLTIDTDDENVFGPYTITATNASGSVDGNTFTVTVAVSSVPAYRTGGSRSLGIRRYI